MIAHVVDANVHPVFDLGMLFALLRFASAADADLWHFRLPWGRRWNDVAAGIQFDTVGSNLEILFTSEAMSDGFLSPI